jgi:hypothetical protein
MPNYHMRHFTQQILTEKHFNHLKSPEKPLKYLVC